MSDKTLIVGNWKMNLNVSEASALLHHLEDRIKAHQDIEVVLAPSLVTIQPLSLQIDRRKFRLAAQNAFFKDEGAFTGEVSFTQLRDLVHYVIIGHSERRLHFEESLDMVKDKVAAAFRNEIIPILCVGETQSELRAGETRQVLHDQITSALSNLTTGEVEDMVIAYEPVWAISTFGGILAKPDDVKKQMDFIRHQVSELYGAKAAKAVRVLYGGSVDDQIVGGFLEIDGCDGVLAGAASLNYHKFAGIVETAYRLNREPKRKNS
jgi:triosephosphate isomerase (TIM)